MNLSHNKQHGLSLVEIMIAITLSLVLLAGVVQLYMSNRMTQRVHDNAARMQEAGRFAMDFQTRDIRMAGYTGCAHMGTSGVTFNNIADPAKYSNAVQQALDFSGRDALNGYNDVSGALAKELTDIGLSLGGGVGDVVSGTDIIVVKGARSCPGGNVVQQMPLTSANIKIADAAQCNITQNSLVMVTDCSSSDLFGVTNNPSAAASKSTLAHSNAVNVGNVLSKAYGLDAAVYNFYMTAYYIGNGSAGQPALFRRDLQGLGFVTQELVDGISDMQVLYGEDTDGDFVADYYVDADNITNMDNVVSVRMDMLARSYEDNLTPEKLQYSYNGATVTAADNRMYQSYSTTITLRNRVK